jgi:hypothetical protein
VGSDGIKSSNCACSTTKYIFQLWQLSHQIHECLPKNNPGWIGHKYNTPGSFFLCLLFFLFFLGGGDFKTQVYANWKAFGCREISQPGWVVTQPRHFK